MMMMMMHRLLAVRSSYCCEFVFGHVCVYSLSTASLSLPATVSVVMVWYYYVDMHCVGLEKEAFTS